MLGAGLLLACASTDRRSSGQDVEACPEVPVVPDSPASSEPAEPDVALEPAPTPDTDDPQTVTRQTNGVTITVRVGERDPEPGLDDETEDHDEAPLGYVRIEVAHEGVETVDVVERPANFADCFVEQVEPAIEFVFSDGEQLVFVANYGCVMGETVVRVTTEHLVLATWEHEAGTGVLYEGTSWYRNNRGLEVNLDKREFYVEAGELAVYSHTVGWCDDRGMKIVLGHARSCEASSRRKLKLLKRVGLGVPSPD